MLNHHKTTESEKIEICRWEYEGEYTLYNLGSYDEMKDTQTGFANPKMRVESFLNQNELIGFCNLYDEGEEVFFGIGVHPACC